MQHDTTLYIADTLELRSQHFLTKHDPSQDCIADPSFVRPSVIDQS